MEERRLSSPTMHLDLNNFDSPEAELSRYVLTSPSSLESCARLGVKPIDLLFKTLTEFMEEHQDTPLEALATLYEACERERRERLRLCRGERDRIIREGKEAVKPFSGLETVLEQVGESQSSDSKARGRGGSAQKSRSVVGFAQDLPRSPSEPKTPYSSQFLPCSHSLGDLRHSPATAKRLCRLRQDICRRLSVSVPDKDCKIAALMMVKQEEEEARLLQSQLEEQRREEARRVEKVRRALLEHRRRKELLRSLCRWQKDIEARRRRQEKEQKEEARRQKREALEQEKRWSKRAKEQEEQRRGKLEMVRKDVEEHRRRQEKLLEEARRREQAEREEELQQAKVREHQARTSKSSKQRREQRRLREENQRERLRHSLLKQEVEEKARAEEEVKRSVLERRLEHSVEKRGRLLEARLRELQERAQREETQARRARLRAGQEYKEHQQEKEMLVQLSRRKMKEAQRHVEEQSRSRAQRVKMENLEREASHCRLWKRVLKDEEVQQEQRQEALALKERRREQLLREREEALERSRKVAHASFCMREMVREQSHSRTFQQMALQAELSAYLSRLKL